jgi:WD40 repeat protein
MRARLAAVALVALAFAGCSDETPTDGGNGDLVQVPGAFLNPDSAAVSPDGARLAVPCDGQICIWDTADGTLAGTLDGGSVVAGSRDLLATDRIDGGTVSLVLLSAKDGAEQSVTAAYETEVVQDAPGDGFQDLAFSPDGETVTGVGGDGVVRLWSVTDPSEVLELDVDAAVAVAYSPEGSRIAVASSDGPVTLHDADSGDEVGSLDTDPQGAVAWSADGSSIATASFALDDEAATTIWDAESLTAVAELPRAGDELAFGPMSESLALTEKNEPMVLVWAWTSDDVIELAGAEGDPRAVLWAPEGALVYAVSAQDGVLAWDLNAGGDPTRFEKVDD